MIKPCILVHCDDGQDDIIVRAFVGINAFKDATNYMNYCKDRDEENQFPPAEYYTSVTELEMLDE